MAVDTMGWALPGGEDPPSSSSSSSSAAPVVSSVVTGVGSAVERFVEFDPLDRGVAALGVDIEAVEVQIRRLEAAQARMIAVFDDRADRVALGGLRDTRDWLVHRLRVSPANAGRRVRAARGCFQLHGQGLDRSLWRVDLPATGQAWIDGELDPGHVHEAVGLHLLLARDLHREPGPDEAALDKQEITRRLEDAEEAVLHAARLIDPDALKVATTHIRAQFAPEAAADVNAHAWDSRTLTLGAALTGMGHLSGLLSGETASLLRHTITHFSPVFGPEDTRLPGQRTHDAFTNALRALSTTGVIPASPQLANSASDPAADSKPVGAVGGESVSTPIGAPVAPIGAPAGVAAGHGGECGVTPTTVRANDVRPDAVRPDAVRPDAVRSDGSDPGCGTAAEVLGRPIAHIDVVCDVQILAGRSNAPASLLDGHPIDADTARKLACDAALTRVLTQGSRIIETSRARVATGAIRRRILLRDANQCRFPGCEHRLRHIHHLTHWAQGGPTSTDNLVGLCWFHHDLIHHEGWTLRGDPDLDELEAIPPNSQHPLHRARRRRANQRTLRRW